MSTPATTLSWPALRAQFPATNFTTTVLPLPEHGVVYLKNPKAGCSSLLLWLDRIHTGDHDFAPHNIHKQHRLPTIKQVGRGPVLRMLSGGAFRFSFVRHPLDRFESVYWDKMVTKREHWRPRNPAAFGIEPGSVVTFEQFLAAVEEQDPVTEMDPHWRPQHVNLMHPLVACDRVGQLENFDRDLQRIREEAGLPDAPIAARNPSPRTDRTSVYDGRPDLVRRVEQLYAEDFELYGY